MKSQPAQSPTSKTKEAPANEKKTPANEKSAQQSLNSSKINVSKNVHPEPCKMEMSTSQKGKQKTRKRIVIEEVDVEGKGRKCVSFYLGLLVVLNCE